MADDAAISNTLLETELHFECLWYEDAWAELDTWSRSAIAGARKESVRHNHISWEFVNRLLIHAARIRRLVSPTSQGSKESPESYSERTKFAAELARRFNPELVNSKDLGKARNIVEHTNEYLMEFLFKHGKKPISVFHITWGSDDVPDGDRYPSFRSYDHATGACSVYGFPTNLRSTLGVVQELRRRTHAHVDGELSELDR